MDIAVVGVGASVTLDRDGFAPQPARSGAVAPTARQVEPVSRILFGAQPMKPHCKDTEAARNVCDPPMTNVGQLNSDHVAGISQSE